MTDHLLTIDALLALEHRGWESLTRHEGGRFYGELMTADALMILVNGMVLDRETIAATLNESPAWSTFSLEEAHLLPGGGAPGPDGGGERRAGLPGDRLPGRTGRALRRPDVEPLHAGGRQARAHPLPADHRDPLTDPLT